jgi:hypothetical protein
MHNKVKRLAMLFFNAVPKFQSNALTYPAYLSPNRYFPSSRIFLVIAVPFQLIFLII